MVQHDRDQLERSIFCGDSFDTHKHHAPVNKLCGLCLHLLCAIFY